jgi:hypothetical protein
MIWGIGCNIYTTYNIYHNVKHLTWFIGQTTLIVDYRYTNYLFTGRMLKKNGTIAMIINNSSTAFRLNGYSMK